MPLEGDRVRLREERLDDVPFLMELRNDLATQAWPKTLPPDFTEPMVRRRLEAREFSFDRRDGRFIVELKDTGERGGYISYSSLEPRWSASLGIMVLPKFWGTTLALEAQETLLRFLFLELGLRVARLWTNSANPRALRLAEKSGFRVSLRQREAAFRAGGLCDLLGMDLLREEYFARHPEHVDHLPPLGPASA